MTACTVWAEKPHFGPRGSPFMYSKTGFSAICCLMVSTVSDMSSPYGFSLELVGPKAVQTRVGLALANADGIFGRFSAGKQVEFASSLPTLQRFIQI